jgi:branched-chain amino acid transport system substrate-binding protein
MKFLARAARVATITAILPFSVAAQSVQGVSSDTIAIGAFGPISGPAAYIGLAGRDGAALAFKEINDAGGIHGRKIRMVFEDDAHSPARALAAVKKLVELDKVFMILSVGGSNATAGTIDYIKERGLPMYVSIASAPAVTYPFVKTMFRGGTTETARYGELYAEFLQSHYKAQRIAILSGRDEYPKNEADATVTKLKDWFNVVPATRQDFNVGDKDFTPQLSAAQRANADVIAFFGNPAEAALALRQARDLGLRQPFFVGANIVDPAFLAATRGAGEGVKGFSLVPALPGSKLPEMVQWEAKWRKEYPNAPVGRPNNFDLLAYADAYVVAEGLRRAGPALTTATLVSGLEKVSNYRVSAIATPRTFTTKHHIGNLQLSPMEVKGGAWEAIQWTGSRESDILKKYP